MYKLTTKIMTIRPMENEILSLDKFFLGRNFLSSKELEKMIISKNYIKENPQVDMVIAKITKVYSINFSVKPTMEVKVTFYYL